MRYLPILLLLFSTMAFAQTPVRDETVTGEVIDFNGATIAGVSRKNCEADPKSKNKVIVCM
jgi:hypothetical protein